MKVLVTGAGGMLARAVLPALESTGHAALALAHADADVTKIGALDHALKTFAPDWIFHFAAFTRVDDCEADPVRAHLVNALGARNVAQAAAASGVALLSISTDYVFNGRATRPYREYDPVDPLSVYGASKLAGEQAVRELHARHLIVRTSWLYGHGGANFIDTILRRARAGESLRVVDDQRGSPTWTRDLAPALIRLAERGQFGTCHCTNRGDCTWYDLAARVLLRAGVTARLERTDSAALSRPAPRPRYSVLSHEFFERISGLTLPEWSDAVDRYVECGA
ncbi:MAG: dTDP-4-dehydrorhamnose reductase [Candidatus Eisenbacteria bacterium]|nr:dTDP-4-dehydrorhamnose reductase [Candidatus Eisenbacteria bacterium]